LCAAGVGAPHIRQRMFWVAEFDEGQRRRLTDGEGCQRDGAQTGREQGDGEPESCGESGWLADREAGRRDQIDSLRGGRVEGERPEHGGGAGGLGDAERERDADAGCRPIVEASSRVQGPDWQRERVWLDPWQPSDLIPCLDGKARRTQPGLRPLAHGVPARASKLRTYGNAIVPQVAAEFVKAYMNVRQIDWGPG